MTRKSQYKRICTMAGNDENGVLLPGDRRVKIDQRPSHSWRREIPEGEDWQYPYIDDRIDI